MLELFEKDLVDPSEKHLSGSQTPNVKSSQEYQEAREVSKGHESGHSYDRRSPTAPATYAELRSAV